MMEPNDTEYYLNIERSKYLELLNFDKTIIKAKDSHLYSDKGEVFLDFTSQYGAVPFGHNPEFLCEELISQQAESPGVMIQPFWSQGAQELAANLVKVAPGNMAHVSFACSGAEAVESAIKMAKAKTGRNAILSTLNSFHGKTMAASLATGNPYYSECFHQATSGFEHIAYDDLQALEQALQTGAFAGFLVEPIQGEGGMVVPSFGYLKGCEELCHQYGTLFIVDEIQTGLGRTGKLFACEYEQVEPDILIIAKALGGGLMPISACIAKQSAWSQGFGQRHSSTFANNHLAARIGLRVVQKLTDDTAVLENIQTVGRYLETELKTLVAEFPTVFRAASGVGLMQGIALKEWCDEESYMAMSACDQGYAIPLVAGYMLNKHKIFTAPTLNASNVLRIQPSYHASIEQIDRLIYGLRDVACLISDGRYSEIFRSAIGLKPGKRAFQETQISKNNIPAIKGKKLGTFAFLIHPTMDIDAVESMPGGMQAYNEEEIEKIIQWINKLKSINGMASAAYYIPYVPSKDGGYVDGWLISSLLTPREMLRLPKAEKKRLMESYINVAQSKGADVIGLGAFTSVISRSGSMVSECGTPVTTGNAYTALTSTDSTRQLCEQREIPLGEASIGIIGVSGSVGRLALLDIGADFGNVRLIGNARNKTNYDKLEVLAGEFLVELCCGDKQNLIKPMYLELSAAGITTSFVAGIVSKYADKDGFVEVFKQARSKYESANGKNVQFPIVLSNNIGEQLPQCNVVITATSNGEAFIKSDMLSPGTIICDVARPSDLTREVLESQRDVLAYEGGLVNLPAELRFGGPNIVGLKTGVSLACLSETIILTMSQVKTNYSLGGVSSIDEARQVFQMGLRHGFTTYLPEDTVDKCEDVKVCV